jgi:recombination protein RecR
MQIPSRLLENAVEQFATLPSIGKRSALRLVLHMLRKSPEEIQTFTETLLDLKKNIKSCNNCGNLSDQTTCSICLDPRRDPTIVCIVEDIRDIMAIENTNSYKGIYHVLGGIISPMDGIGPIDLNIPTLIAKLENGGISEIIFALNATMEGDTTNYYLNKKIQHFNLIVTTLSRGVAVGSELHYADEATLGRSIIYRQPFEAK